MFGSFHRGISRALHKAPCVGGPAAVGILTVQEAELGHNAKANGFFLYLGASLWGASS